MRSASKSIAITQCAYEQKQFEAPSHATVQNLVLRIGLYELQRPKEVADDWIWVVDHTIQIGTVKILLVLGIRAQTFGQLQRPLECRDMCVLELLPVKQSNGEIVKEQLQRVAERTGVPHAIVSDDGSDLRKGIELLRKDHAKVVPLQDIVHKVSRLNKAILEEDPQWPSYRTQCTQTANAIRQSELAHLRPPTPKTKARHMNLDPEIRWGLGVLDLLRRARAGELDAKQTAELPLELLEQKFGWLEQYSRSLAAWGSLMEVGQTICRVVRREGYHRKISAGVSAAIARPLDEPSTRLLDRSLAFLGKTEIDIPEGKKLLGSSEVIESLIGKGKRLEGHQSKSGFTSQILAMAASVGHPTGEMIQAALECCRIKHVKAWCATYLGTSVQSRRRRDLGPVKDKKLRKADIAATPNF